MNKTKNHTELSIDIRSTERAAVRAEVFQYWIKEEPGTAIVRNTYRYNAEKLSDGSRIYLTRPTRLNKGADFVICCENFTKFKNGNDKPPSHGDLITELCQLGKDRVLPLIREHIKRPSFLAGRLYIDFSKEYFPALTRFVGFIHRFSPHQISNLIRNNRRKAPTMSLHY